jgi:hypothetical protein
MVHPLGEENITAFMLLSSVFDLRLRRARPMEHMPFCINKLNINNEAASSGVSRSNSLTMC